MGNNQKEPYQNIDLFIQVSKNIYQSGQKIEGKIHLNIKTELNPYEKLVLAFYAQETFLQKASSQTNCSYQTVSKITYQSQQTIHSFYKQKLEAGQYTFPFQIKLPQNLPTNFNVQNQNDKLNQNQKNISIKYAIKAQLNGDIRFQSQQKRNAAKKVNDDIGADKDKNQQNKQNVEYLKQNKNDQKNNKIDEKINANRNGNLTESYVMKYGNLTKVHYLNILKPFNSQIQPLNQQATEVNSYCLCLQGGATKVSVFINKNFCHTGQIIEINGQVDNLFSRQPLQTLTCQLIERNIVSNQKKIFYNEKQRGVLHTVKKFYVKKGNVQNFSFSYKIPDYLQHSHSIGNHSALVYKLRFQYKLQVSCGNQISKIDFPIQIQTKTPKLQVNIDEIPSSYQWVPKFMALFKLPMKQSYDYKIEYPLQNYRVELQKHKKQTPSFNYFNKMNQQYLTKTPQQLKYQNSSNNNTKEPLQNDGVKNTQSQGQQTQRQQSKVVRPRSKIFSLNSK